jgi:hypothetical protein
MIIGKSYGTIMLYNELKILIILFVFMMKNSLCHLERSEGPFHCCPLRFFASAQNDVIGSCNIIRRLHTVLVFVYSLSYIIIYLMIEYLNRKLYLNINKNQENLAFTFLYLLMPVQ